MDEEAVITRSHTYPVFVTGTAQLENLLEGQAAHVEKRNKNRVCDTIPGHVVGLQLHA